MIAQRSRIMGSRRGCRPRPKTSTVRDETRYWRATGPRRAAGSGGKRLAHDADGRRTPFHLLLMPGGHPDALPKRDGLYVSRADCPAFFARRFTSRARSCIWPRVANPSAPTAAPWSRVRGRGPQLPRSGCSRRCGSCLTTHELSHHGVSRPAAACTTGSCQSSGATSTAASRGPQVPGSYSMTGGIAWSTGSTMRQACST